MRLESLILVSLSFFLIACSPHESPRNYDVVVCGGTSAAVTSAVQAKRMGKSVAIVCPDTHLGGLSSGGLGWTDSGSKGVIGGLSREFYQRVYDHYQKPHAWKWQDREVYGNQGQGTPAIDGEPRSHLIKTIQHSNNRILDTVLEKHDKETIDALDHKFHHVFGLYQEVMNHRKEFLQKVPAISYS